MPFHGILSLLVVLLAIVGVFALIRLLVKPRAGLNETGGRSPGLDALEQRYANGEIERDEYLQKKADLGG